MAKKSNIAIVVEGLQKTREACIQLLTEEHANLAIRCDHQLNILINQLSHAGGVLTGTGNTPAPAKAEPQKPMTHFLGIPITGAPQHVKPEALEPTDTEKEQLQALVEQAFNDFQTLDASILKKNYDDLTVRALAVSVGMDVTPTNPDKVNVAFIREVIDVVKAKAEQLKQDEDAEEAAKKTAETTTETKTTESGATTTV